ncbi:hypothetical protein CDL15_Pgr023356 [Punica granatum]|uniref:Uncharacterized protein n=1 Tax=Punica granatum TaxID=22663 RepID=A0A218Y166_PUNGR|nr:hypothetical protein CDL15_Pgr023356 [Punica granatum]
MVLPTSSCPPQQYLFSGPRKHTEQADICLGGQDLSPPHSLEASSWCHGDEERNECDGQRRLGSSTSYSLGNNSIPLLVVPFSRGNWKVETIVKEFYSRDSGAQGKNIPA